MVGMRLFCSLNRTILEHGGVLLGLEQSENLLRGLKKVKIIVPLLLNCTLFAM